MLTTIQAAGAADLLDGATKRLASRLDDSDTDEGMERIQTELNEAITSAIVDVAYRHGWAAWPGRDGA
jgi:hypothetical protein